MSSGGRLAGWLVAAWLWFGVAPVAAAEAPSGACSWPAWEQFRQGFLEASGRVVDPGAKGRTVSEGQAYALFFALVANDRAGFDRILTWTEANLAGGDLTARLPAWHWGRRADGSWGVLDANSASDADLWMAYTLAEAGRVWHDRRFTALATLLANRILREETRFLPNLGPTLLPAPQGFHPAADLWRLNPSYVPLQLLRRLAALHPDSPWPKVAASSLRLLLETAPKGFSPDWSEYHATRGFQPDTSSRAEGSYDAIRVYLWAGMLHRGDPAAAPLLRALRPMAAHVAEQGRPPGVVDTRSGMTAEAGPVGFSAALLPFLTATGASEAARGQLAKVEAGPPAARAYYDNVLTLFALGWHEGWYRFEPDGAAALRWQAGCDANSTSFSPRG
jgi:endoglucanase